MKNPNQLGSRPNTMLPLSRMIIGLGASAALAAGLTYQVLRQSPRAEHTPQTPAALAQLERQYPDHQLVTAPGNAQIEVFLGNDGTAPAGYDNVAKASADGGKHWNAIPTPPFTSLGNKPFILSVSMAPKAMKRADGGQLMAIGYQNGHPENSAVALDEITSDGTVERIDNEGGTISTGLMNGTWEQQDGVILFSAQEGARGGADDVITVSTSQKSQADATLAPGQVGK